MCVCVRERESARARERDCATGWRRCMDALSCRFFFGGFFLAKGEPYNHWLVWTKESCRQQTIGLFCGKLQVSFCKRATDYRALQSNGSFAQKRVLQAIDYRALLRKGCRSLSVEEPLGIRLYNQWLLCTKVAGLFLQKSHRLQGSFVDSCRSFSAKEEP